MKIYLEPQPENFPLRGGVKEHLFQLYRQIIGDSDVIPVKKPEHADILIIESAWSVPGIDRPVIYVCHGGFEPEPIPTVLKNLRKATVIVSVAEWLVLKYFPIYKEKTVVIPNGVMLKEFDEIEENAAGDYILYAKEYEWEFNDFLVLAGLHPNVKFMTTVWPSDRTLPSNVRYIGLQTGKHIKRYLKQAGALLMTGSEVCPTMVLEAWAARTPVLGKNKHGIAELMGENKGGYLYDEPSTAPVAEILEKSKELGAQGRSIVEAHYQWYDVWHGAYKPLIENILMKEN